MGNQGALVASIIQMARLEDRECMDQKGISAKRRASTCKRARTEDSLTGTSRPLSARLSKRCKETRRDRFPIARRCQISCIVLQRCQQRFLFYHR